MKFLSRTYIKSHEVQSDLYVRFPHLVRIFQDAAFEHSNSVGAGVSELIKQGLAWVLYSMYIEVYDYPKLNDKITTITWSKGRKGITSERDYQVFSGNKKIILASTTWVLFNLEKRKATNIPEEIVSVYKPEKFNVFPRADKILPYDKNMSYEYSYKFQTRFLDLDSNNHVNNITYIDYICTAIYRVLQEHVFISNFNITYKKEITIDVENVEIQLNKSLNEFYFRITSENTLFALGRVVYYNK